MDKCLCKEVGHLQRYTLWIDHSSAQNIKIHYAILSHVCIYMYTCMH